MMLVQPGVRAEQALEVRQRGGLLKAQAEPIPTTRLCEDRIASASVPLGTHHNGVLDLTAQLRGLTLRLVRAAETFGGRMVSRLVTMASAAGGHRAGAHAPMLRRVLGKKARARNPAGAGSL